MIFIMMTIVGVLDTSIFQAAQGWAPYVCAPKETRAHGCGGEVVLRTS